MERKLYIPENIDTVETQRQLVSQTNSLVKYTALHNRYFTNRDFFIDTVAKEQGDRKVGVTSDEEYFRFLSQVGMQAAQFGYPLLEGQILFNYRGKGYTKPATHPYHQLALASYIGNLNEQVYPYKEDVSRFDDKGSDAYWGAWGVLYESKKGHILPPNLPLFNRRIAAEQRFDDKRQICLPDRALNRNLGELKITGVMVDRMSVRDFEKELLPEVHSALVGRVNAVTVFLADPRLDTKDKHYSLPKP